ncbi:MAG TPA: hypothetical protein PLV25_08065, partial [Opitutales bacterium]|nr:hypothetical protein [Opitutales bacterium]
AKNAPAYTTIAYTAAAVAIPLVAYISNDVLDFKGRIQTPLDSFFTLNKLFDKDAVLSAHEASEVYNTFWENPAEAIGRVQTDIGKLYQN